jgi:hypothetical protein
MSSTWQCYLVLVGLGSIGPASIFLVIMTTWNSSTLWQIKVTIGDGNKACFGVTRGLTMGTAPRQLRPLSSPSPEWNLGRKGRQCMLTHGFTKLIIPAVFWSITLRSLCGFAISLWFSNSMRMSTTLSFGNSTLSGCYSSASAYKAQFIGTIKSHMNTIVWKNWVPPSATFCSWFIIQNHVRTVDHVLWCGWPNCGNCKLCNSAPKSAAHLLFHYWFCCGPWLGIGLRTLPSFDLVAYAAFHDVEVW